MPWDEWRRSVPATLGSASAGKLDDWGKARRGLWLENLGKPWWISHDFIDLTWNGEFAGEGDFSSKIWGSIWNSREGVRNKCDFCDNSGNGSFFKSGTKLEKECSFV